MNDLIIEPITDAAVLTRCADILTLAYNAPPWNDEWTPAIALEKLTCFYDSPRFLGWTARRGEQLLGCCVGNIEPYFTGDYFYLKEMFVAPAAQQQGIGAALMETLKAHLANAGVRTMILFTGKDFYPFDFYLKSGFQEMEGMRMMHWEGAQ